MSIEKELGSIPMEELIGAPLNSAAAVDRTNKKATEDFIKQNGFDHNKIDFKNMNVNEEEKIIIGFENDNPEKLK